MLQKKVIMNIPSVYTANAFRAGNEHYIGAGSETEKIVHLYDLGRSTSSQVTGCPGGMMSFIAVPGEPDLFITIQGLFPPFIGAEAGLFMHKRTGEAWETTKVLDMPFSHRCEILNRDGRNYLFLTTVSKHKDNPADWSRPGETHLIKLGELSGGTWKTEVIDNSITRNHGMSRAKIDGQDTLLISGAQGIF